VGGWTKHIGCMRWWGGAHIGGEQRRHDLLESRLDLSTEPSLESANTASTYLWQCQPPPCACGCDVTHAMLITSPRTCKVNSAALMLSEIVAVTVPVESSL